MYVSFLYLVVYILVLFSCCSYIYVVFISNTLFQYCCYSHPPLNFLSFILLRPPPPPFPFIFLHIPFPFIFVALIYIYIYTRNFGTPLLCSLLTVVGATLVVT